MAPPPGTLRVGRYFLALAGLLAVLYTVILIPGQRHAPKLGIDLVGGVRVIFTAQTPKGSPAPTQSQMTQARQILEDRINSTGVTGATVVVQGSDQLVVEIPNGTGTDVARLGKAAVLNFRGVIAPAQPVTCGLATPAATAGSSANPSASPSASTTGSATVTSSAKPGSHSSSKAPHDAARRPLNAPSGTSSGSAPRPGGSSTSGSAKVSTTPGAASSAAPRKCLTDPLAVLFQIDPSLKAKMPNAETCPAPGIDAKDCRPFSALTSAQQSEIASALQQYDCSAAQSEADLPNSHYIACDNGRLSGLKTAFLLGYVVVPGRHIDSASSQAPDTSGNGGSTTWTVRLTLDSTGADRWHAWTSKYHTAQQSVSPVQTSATAPCGPSAAVPCSDFVAFTLDGQVISDPVTLAVLDRETSVSGNFSQSQANDLARELNYGKLPLSFRADANQHVSATLGSAQLSAAVLAGGIGLALVVIYSLLYYRALGLVTIASLLVSAALTYAMLVILGTQLGYTLDLAGIAGFIVALGITADSFVVFFERIKDEVHGGRSMRVAVPRAWVRARRTVLSADTVSFLAAAILYYFASADVKGFAFTLGMSTVLDVVVVFLFTHPIVALLSRSKAFGSARFTGLSSVRVGGIARDDQPASDTPRRTSARRASRAARASSVAVLDDVELDETDRDETDRDEAATGDAEARGSARRSTEPPARADSGEDERADGPPRRSVPQAGSAAERAAARRARMRDQTRGREKS